ncbi:MAG: transketolase [Candidatus Omnitrophica bacterium]|nr:transketolase [Candidatus Omnitrophota bacterium]
MKNKKNEYGELGILSRKIRLSVLDMIHRTKSPHIGSSLSAVDILVALYFEIMNIDPKGQCGKNKDRFILSKGHACAALYAVMAERGIIDADTINGFARNGGALEQHPNKHHCEGIEVSTGSLGHGLSIGAGMALSGKVDRKAYKVYVLLSDGEMNEGSVWEAVMFAAHQGLDNLIALVDANKIQAMGCTKDIIGLDPISEKWRSFGWHVQDIDGHDFREIINAFKNIMPGKPNAIILNTSKGKGVSFMENNVLWHYRSPDEVEYRDARKELAK